MIEDCGFETTAGDVTDTAILSRRHMRPVELVHLTDGDDAVMTRHTGLTRYQRRTVINESRIERRGIMTRHAIGIGIRGHAVNQSIGHAQGANRDIISIMTCCTTAIDSDVGESRRQERGLGMTAIAILFGGYVSLWFTRYRDIGGSELTVMAAFATAVDGDVDIGIEARWMKRTNVMTTRAIVHGWDMNLCRFTGANDAIMTA